ncbi:MAG: gamma-glutamyl kinase [Rhodobacteraceae bacterium]|nr:gamma-glutamyl kinase [Paracoccaceae bacterium]
MLVFVKEKLVLLAVPKTGTTALHAALAPRAGIVMRDPPELKHTPLRRYKRYIAPMVEHDDVPLQTLAVLRHPVDWLGSWYRYRHRDKLVGQPNSTRDISFDDFVSEYVKGKPAAYAAIGAQARFVKNAAGEVGVDHLFQYENQPGLRGFLEERLSVKLDLPQRNVSPKMELSLSAPIRAKLERKCAAEFEIWETARR